MLLSDDLLEWQGIEEALAAARGEYSKLSTERHELASSVAEFKATEQAKCARVAELTRQVEQLEARVGELGRRESELVPTIQKHEAIAASIEAAERNLEELRAEENRLSVDRCAISRDREEP
jgi:chromosome segregation ATPase